MRGVSNYAEAAQIDKHTVAFRGVPIAYKATAKRYIYSSRKH